MKVITSLLLSLLLYSCGKDDFKGNKGIVGKWQLSEQTSGLGIAGGVWLPVPPNYIKQIQFYSNGSFEQYETTRGVPQTCTGSYQLVGDSLLIINSSCNANPDTTTIGKLSTTQLQLNYADEFLKGERYNAIK